MISKPLYGHSLARRYPGLSDLYQDLHLLYTVHTGIAERMRRITTFVVLLQVIWDIPNQVFTVNASCLQ